MRLVLGLALVFLTPHARAGEWQYARFHHRQPMPQASPVAAPIPVAQASPAPPSHHSDPPPSAGNYWGGTGRVPHHAHERHEHERERERRERERERREWWRERHWE